MFQITSEGRVVWASTGRQVAATELSSLSPCDRTNYGILCYTALQRDATPDRPRTM